MEKILILCNEFSRGNAIGRHCEFLSKRLLEEGIGTEMVSLKGKADEGPGNRVHIVEPILNANNPFNWTMLANNELKQKGREIYEERGFSLVHAHDWTTAIAGMALSKLTGKPLVLTLHSTEHNRGFCNQHSQVVSSIEWWASFEARRVIVDNRDAYNSVKYDLNLPEDKIRIADPMQHGWQEKVIEEYRKAEQGAIA